MLLVVRYVHIYYILMYTFLHVYTNLYSEVDENDSNVNENDEDDDLLADEEGVPEDDIEEVESQD